MLGLSNQLGVKYIYHHSVRWLPTKQTPGLRKLMGKPLLQAKATFIYIGLVYIHIISCWKVFHLDSLKVHFSQYIVTFKHRLGNALDKIIRKLWNPVIIFEKILCDKQLCDMFTHENTALQGTLAVNVSQSKSSSSYWRHN